MRRETAGPDGTEREPVVWLVGAGPGDPELLTLKALRVLQAAEVVVHDRLVSQGVLDYLSPVATRIFVGKSEGRHELDQGEINDLLVRLARTGRVVVRLKGGDPLVFGRGGEEALHLLRHGIGVEIVPGITAAAGVAASCLVPLTHRGLATGVRFVTGHCRAGWWLDLDWQSLADPETTLVVYMGLSHIAEIAGRLVDAGLSPATPAMAVQEGTTARQRSVRASLTELEHAVAGAGLASPVLFIIGPVVDVLRQRLDATEGPTVRPEAMVEALLHA